jgi:hypothetical protein
VRRGVHRLLCNSSSWNQCKQACRTFVRKRKFPATRPYERYFREFPSFSFNLRHERQRQPRKAWRSLNTKRNSKNKKKILVPADDNQSLISQCFVYIIRWSTLALLCSDGENMKMARFSRRAPFGENFPAAKFSRLFLVFGKLKPTCLGTNCHCSRPTGG